MDHTGSARMARLRIGDWDIVPELNELQRGTEKIRVEPKAMELLLFLAARPGQVIGRTELLNAVWPGVVVGDETLTQAVTKLRKALADQAREPAYIETISKRGYRLVAEVRNVHSVDKHVPAGPAEQDRSVSRDIAERNPKARKFLLIALGVVSLAVASVGVRLSVHESPAYSSGVGTQAPADSGQKTAAATTVAIAPFENLTGDQQHDYLARGIAADLATDLANFSGVSVLESAHTESAARDGRQAVKDAAQYRVTGTLQSIGAQMRVNVRLVDTTTGRHIWSERYERPSVDLMGIQSAIVSSLLEKLPVKVSEAERRRVSRRYTLNEQAYDYFLRGQALLASRGHNETAQAREMYRKAIELDPAFARAYAALALTYAYEHRYQWTGTSAQALGRALQLAQTSRQINQEIPEVYWVLAFVHAQRKEHQEAISNLKKAIELNASYGDAYAFMGAVYTYIGEFDKALGFLRNAMRFNREGRAYIFELLGRSYFFLGDMEQALINLREAVLRNPSVVDPRVFLSAALVASGQHTAARWEADEIIGVDPSFTLKRWIDTYPTTEESQKTQIFTLLAQVGL